MLASSALCNIMASKPAIKVTAIDQGAVESFSEVLMSPQSGEKLRIACAGALFNLASPAVAQRYTSQVVKVLMKVDVSSMIETRLGRF